VQTGVIAKFANIPRAVIDPGTSFSLGTRRGSVHWNSPLNQNVRRTRTKHGQIEKGTYDRCPKLL